MMGALLADGLRRAASDPQIGHWACTMRLSIAPAEQILAALSVADYPEVIYLDPMFPERSGSALSALKMRVLRLMVDSAQGDAEAERSATEGNTEAAIGLLTLARAKARKRVVVKRPKQAAPLDHQKPHHCIQTRSHRYDVYM